MKHINEPGLLSILYGVHLSGGVRACSQTRCVLAAFYLLASY